MPGLPDDLPKERTRQGGPHGLQESPPRCNPASLFSAAQNPGAVEEILDLENKRMADDLASKVTRLKSVSDASELDRCCFEATPGPAQG